MSTLLKGEQLFLSGKLDYDGIKEKVSWSNKSIVAGLNQGFIYVKIGPMAPTVVLGLNGAHFLLRDSVIFYFL